MAKELLFKEHLLLKLSEGVRKIQDAVGVTLGPNGQNVIISRDNAIMITKDGVSVAREVDLKDPLEAVGAQLIKQIAHKTALEAGDGTTTSTILASEMFLQGVDYLKGGVSPVDIKTGMEIRVKQIINELKSSARKIQKDDITTIHNIATISANNDSEIGSLIAKAYEAIGFDGVITVQESKTSETNILITDGFQFDQGYVSPFFAMNEKSVVEHQKPLIFIYDGRIQTFNDIFQLCEYASLNKMPIIIICDGVDVEALNHVLINATKAGLKICIIKAPAYGEQRYNMLNDMATIIGGTVISEKDGNTIRSITKDRLSDFVGSCHKIEISATSTTIIGGVGQISDIEARAQEIKNAANEEKNPSQKLILMERAAKIENGVAILSVGANSELELREKFERIDDALSATKAAILEGYVAGGGSSLYELSKMPCDTKYDNEGILAGINIINLACRAPFQKIVTNSSKTVYDIVERLHDGLGYNAKTDTVENLIETGVIDPVKVTRCSLENSLSVASLMLTTGCMMVKVEETVAYNSSL